MAGPQAGVRPDPGAGHDDLATSLCHTETCRGGTMLIETFLNPEIIAAAWPILLQGLLMTVLLSVLVVPLGAIGGVILAVLSTVHHRAVRWPLMAWVDFFRAFPPLVLLILIYAGLPFAGIQLNAFGCVAIGFLLNTS